MAHIIYTGTSGQSLAQGAQGGASLTPVAEAGNARTVTSAGSTTAHQNSSADLNRPDLSMGSRLAQADPSKSWYFSSHATGGTSIEQLSKGGTTGRYEELIAYHDAGKTLAIGNGHTWETGNFHWIQGERDQGQENTPREVYVQRMQQLLDDYRADLAAPALAMFSSQTATNGYYDNEPRISLAQLDAARSLPGIYLVGGQYQLPYITDKLHLTNVGYYRLGELHARAEIAVRAGAGWAPFAPTAVTLDGTGQVITVAMHVPAPPLAWDTTVVAAQPNMGFSLHGTAAAIVSVEITGPSTVTITTTADVSGDPVEVGYAVAYNDGGASFGNLRDSHPALSAYDSTPLRNWALQFRDPVSGTTYAGPTTAFKADSIYLVGSQGQLYPITEIPA